MIGREVAAVLDDGGGLVRSFQEITMTETQRLAGQHLIEAFMRLYFAALDVHFTAPDDPQLIREIPEVCAAGDELAYAVVRWVCECTPTDSRQVDAYMERRRRRDPAAVRLRPRREV